MGITTNLITAGDYKNGDIKIKGFGKKVVIVSKFLGIEHPLDKNTVDHIELLDKAQGLTNFVGMKHYQVAIYFKNGKKSIAKMEYNLYHKLNEILF